MSKNHHHYDHDGDYVDDGSDLYDDAFEDDLSAEDFSPEEAPFEEDPPEEEQSTCFGCLVITAMILIERMIMVCSVLLTFRAWFFPNQNAYR